MRRPVKQRIASPTVVAARAQFNGEAMNRRLEFTRNTAIYGTAFHAYVAASLHSALKPPTNNPLGNALYLVSTDGIDLSKMIMYPQKVGGTKFDRVFAR
jgi:hypothetical protein